MHTTPSITSYCALGDSFTEGMMDTAPGDDPQRFRGWADRLAEKLTTSPIGTRDLRYANLAIRGRLLQAIVDEQVPRALELKPDLVSIVGGGNDCIRPKTDVDQLAATMDETVATFRKAGIQVLMATGYDTEYAPLLSAVRGRVGIYTSHLWTIAQRHDAYMLNVWGVQRLKSWDFWAPDRLHLSASGHEILADEALAVLEGNPLPSAGHPTPARPNRPVRQTVTEESKWVREHLAPWVGRRLRHESSGDGRLAKQPELRPVIAPEDE